MDAQQNPQEGDWVLDIFWAFVKHFEIPLVWQHGRNCFAVICYHGNFCDPWAQIEDKGVQPGAEANGGCNTEDYPVAHKISNIFNFGKEGLVWSINSVRTKDDQASNEEVREVRFYELQADNQIIEHDDNHVLNGYQRMLEERDLFWVEEFETDFLLCFILLSCMELGFQFISHCECLCFHSMYVLSQLKLDLV